MHHQDRDRDLLQVTYVRRSYGCAVRLHDIGLKRVTSVDRPARELSGGERQSLAVMRAVYFGTSVLLLDEPTVSLSARETSNVLAAVVESRNRGLGILYIDHNVSHVLRIADRIVVLEHGRLTSTPGSDREEHADVCLRRTPAVPPVQLD